MKAGDFLLGVLAGAVGYYLWLRMSEKKQSSGALAEQVNLAKEVIVEESAKFGGVLQKQYDIVMPSDIVNKKVRKKAKELTKGRNSIDPTKITQPVSL